MTTYKVLDVKPTGKDDPKFGTEFWVKLDNEDVAKLWFKNAPAVGTELDLEKTDKGYKKVKKEWKPSSEKSSSESSSSSSSSRSSATKPVYKDNSLGMRIGMCINNAAQYVNSLDIQDKEGLPKILSPDEWADTVTSYALELFTRTDDKKFVEAEAKEVIKGEPVVIPEDENPFA